MHPPQTTLAPRDLRALIRRRWGKSHVVALKQDAHRRLVLEISGRHLEDGSAGSVGIRTDDAYLAHMAPVAKYMARWAGSDLSAYVARQILTTPRTPAHHVFGLLDRPVRILVGTRFMLK